MRATASTRLTGAIAVHKHTVSFRPIEGISALRIVLLITLTAIALIAKSAHAQESPEQPPQPSAQKIPNCLNQTIAGQIAQGLHSRGVQKRHFLKRNQIQIAAQGGFFASDLFSSSYAIGGAMAYYITEDFGFEISLHLTPIALDLESPLSDFFGDRRLESKFGYLPSAGLLWSPIHGKLRMADTIIHSDIVLTVGGGRLFHDSTQGIATHAGASLEMYMNQWITMRFGIRDVVVVQEVAAETRLTNNLMATFGIALWIPTSL